jgi:hypothetical protein
VFESILEGGRELATHKAVKEAIAAIDGLAFDLLFRGCWVGPRSKGKGAGPATSEKSNIFGGVFGKKHAKEKNEATAQAESDVSESGSDERSI